MLWQRSQLVCDRPLLPFALLLAGPLHRLSSAVILRKEGSTMKLEILQIMCKEWRPVVPALGKSMRPLLLQNHPQEHAGAIRAHSDPGGHS
jgi:hypothetical protein